MRGQPAWALVDLWLQCPHFTLSMKEQSVRKGICAPGDGEVRRQGPCRSSPSEWPPHLTEALLPMGLEETRLQKMFKQVFRIYPTPCHQAAVRADDSNAPGETSW